MAVDWDGWGIWDGGRGDIDSGVLVVELSESHGMHRLHRFFLSCFIIFLIV